MIPVRLLVPPDRCDAGALPDVRPSCPAAATLICVLIVAASTAEYQPPVSPRLASRSAMATQRSSRSFIMQRTGEAMKIDE